MGLLFTVWALMGTGGLHLSTVQLMLIIKLSLIISVGSLSLIIIKKEVTQFAA